MAENDSINTETIDHAYRHLIEIGSCMLAIRQLSVLMVDGQPHRAGALGMGVIALSEKAGYLADKSIDLLRQAPGVCGNFDDWMNSGR